MNHLTSPALVDLLFAFFAAICWKHWYHCGNIAPQCTNGITNGTIGKTLNDNLSTIGKNFTNGKNSGGTRYPLMYKVNPGHTGWLLVSKTTAVFPRSLLCFHFTAVFEYIQQPPGTSPHFLGKNTGQNPDHHRGGGVTNDLCIRRACYVI